MYIMENYDTQICKIIEDINLYFTDTNRMEVSSNKQLFNDDMLKHMEHCKKTDSKHCNSLFSNIDLIKSNIKNIFTTTRDDPLLLLWQRLNNLDNQIQNETMNNYSYENNDEDSYSLISEQNKQFENIKFNNTYLFLFNIGIIGIIIKSLFYKKTY